MYFSPVKLDLNLRKGKRKKHFILNYTNLCYQKYKKKNYLKIEKHFKFFSKITFLIERWRSSENFW